MTPNDDNVVQLTFELLKRMDAKLERMSLSPSTPESESVTNELIFNMLQRLQSDVTLLRNSFHDQQLSINGLRKEINLLRVERTATIRASRD